MRVLTLAGIEIVASLALASSPSRSCDDSAAPRLTFKIVGAALVSPSKIE
jgi:hypothetical protein